MTINRVDGVPFAQIANAALRDKRLSFRARGILAMVLSHSGEWEAPRRWLIDQGTEGRDAVQSALNELTEYGYREVFNERTATGIRTVVVWHQVPQTSDSWGTGSPTTGIPDHRETRPPSEDHPSEHHIPEHHQEIALLSDLPATRPERFDEFWIVYPRRAAKQAAYKAWMKATKDTDPQVIIDGAARYAADPNREDAFTAHAATWLNAGRWEDAPLPARNGGKQTGSDAFRQIAAQYAGGER